MFDIQYARQLMVQKKYPSLIDYSLAYLEEESHNPIFLHLLGKAYLAVQQPYKAAVLLQRSLQLRSNQTMSRDWQNFIQLKAFWPSYYGPLSDEAAWQIIKLQPDEDSFYWIEQSFDQWYQSPELQHGFSCFADYLLGEWQDDEPIANDYLNYQELEELGLLDNYLATIGAD